MQRKLSKGWGMIQTASLFICPGSYYALNVINNKELLPWLRPEWLPFFGVPLLIIFCASCMFGVQGLVSMTADLNSRYKNLMEIERKYKNDKDRQDQNKS